MDIEKTIKDNINKILSKNQKKILLDYKSINTLVLSGGGVKGLYYIGILKKLEELNIINNINTIAGTSIGAFFGSLISIGYTYQELADFVLLFNLSNIKKISPSNFFSYFGIDDGNNLELVLEKMFSLKGFEKNITFRELFEKTKKELIITGVCINEKKCYYFSYKNTPEMNVLQSIRISASIPLYFTPIQYNDKLWVDGGIIDNYPINLFKYKLNTTLGIYLCESKEYTEVKNLEDYFLCVIQSLMEGLSERSITGFENNTIIIKSDKFNILDTNFSKETILNYINLGYDTINDYLIS
jgi:NTE family protein